MRDDERIGPNPAALLFRHVLAQRLRTLVAPGSRVLDLRRGSDSALVGAAGLDVRVVDAGRAAFGVGSRRDLDAAYAGPGALDGVDLGAMGRVLAAALRPGAPVLLCLGRRRTPERPGLREARARLGPDFVWRGAFALGVLVPGESRQDWVRAHPQAFAVLAACEGVVRRWPVLRALGDYTALEGARR